MTFIDYLPALFFVTLGLAVGFGVLIAANRLVRRIAPEKPNRKRGPKS